MLVQQPYEYTYSDLRFWRKIFWPKQAFWARTYLVIVLRQSPMRQAGMFQTPLGNVSCKQNYMQCKIYPKLSFIRVRLQWCNRMGTMEPISKIYRSHTTKRNFQRHWKCNLKIKQTKQRVRDPLQSTVFVRPPPRWQDREFLKIHFEALR